MKRQSDRRARGITRLRNPENLRKLGIRQRQVLRVCEVSQLLGVGIPCTYLNSASNTIIDGDSENVTFSCPAVRDATVAGAGGYSLSNAPLLPSDLTEPAACTQH